MTYKEVRYTCGHKAYWPVSTQTLRKLLAQNCCACNSDREIRRDRVAMHYSHDPEMVLDWCNMNCILEDQADMDAEELGGLHL